MKKQTRINEATTRLTNKEFAFVQRKAKERELSLSQYIRTLILDEIERWK
jgi:hypothetical protein